MADYFVTQRDIDLLYKPKKLHLKAYLLNQQNQILDQLEGLITSGNGSEDSASDTRRTCSFTIHSLDSTYNIGEFNRIWLNNRVRIDIGFEDFDQIYWYTKGIYLFDSCDYAYSGSARDISFQCSDLVKSIDGTHGGTLIGQSFVIKGHTYDEETDTYKGEDIKEVVETLLSDHGITEFRVDTIGQVSCLQGYSQNWKQNRINTGTSEETANRDEANGWDDLENDHGTWHMFPYDLEFSAGTSLWEILVNIRDLYSGYEMYFDQDGMFIFQLTPICNQDSNLLDCHHFEGLVISENASYDLTTVKNATKIYGESIEADRFADKCAAISTTYDKQTVLSIEPSFETEFAYCSNTVLGMIFPEIISENLQKPAYLTINQETLPITDRKVAPQVSDSEKYEYFSESKKYTAGEGCLYNQTRYRFLTDKPAGKWDMNKVERVNSSSTTTAGSNLISYEPMSYADFNATDVYCFKYLSTQKSWVYVGMYQIEGYAENTDKNSPFSIDKIGYRLQVLSGGQYDDISTSTLAQERAEYETWLVSRLNDTVTLQTVIIPFLEVNKKIQYRKLSDGCIDSYIIKSLSYSYTDGTMTITMMKFYELDPFIVHS